MGGNNKMDTTLSTEWKQQIRHLRIRLEKSVEELKRLENIGTADATRDAFWLTDSTI